MKPFVQTRRKQRGVTLVVTLVMLVVITLVGVASIRNATMDEKMAGNSRDRDKAFQAAEAAVQKCLADLKAGSYTLAALAPAVASATPHWEVEANWGNANSVEVNLGAAANLAAQPRCMYEELGAGTGNYRVTGRAVGGSSLTVVMLQATFAID